MEYLEMNITDLITDIKKVEEDTVMDVPASDDFELNTWSGYQFTISVPEDDPWMGKYPELELLNNRIFVYRNHGRGCDDIVHYSISRLDVGNDEEMVDFLERKHMYINVVEHDNPKTFLEELANYLDNKRNYENYRKLFNVKYYE